MFRVKQILDKYWERNVNVVQILPDLQKAYDSVDRTEIGRIVWKFRIARKNCSIIIIIIIIIIIVINTTNCN